MSKKRTEVPKAERASTQERIGKRARPGAGSTDGFPSIAWWLPAAVFIGLTLLLFREFVFGDQMLVGQDTLGLGYTARAFYADALRVFGSIPRWAPQILGGTPFIEALAAGDSLYPPSVLLLLVMEPYRALGWKLVLHVALAGFFMFGWMRTVGVSRAASLVAGVGYMLAPFFVSLVHPGHDGKMFVTALMPLLFWAVERHFVEARIRHFAAIALVVGSVILTTHFQMAYFLFGATGLYAIFRTIQIWRAPQDEVDAPDGIESPTKTRGRVAGLRFGVFLAASMAGAAIAAVQFLPAYEYINESSRRVATTREASGETSVAWASSWSMHPEEAMSLLIPEFPGASGGQADWAERSYWGRNFFKSNSEYIGLVLLLLVGVSFVGTASSGFRWFFTGLGALGFLFAVGTTTPVWRILYEVVPKIDLFRAPSQVIFLTGFSVATLAGLGVDRILRAASEDDREAWKGIMKVLWGGVGVMGGLLLLMSSGVLISLWTSVLYADIAPDRLAVLQNFTPLLTRGAGIAFMLALVTAGLGWALRTGYLAPAGLVVGLIALIAVDEMRIDAPFIQTIDFQSWSTPDAHVQAILDREAGSTEPYRLLSLVSNGQDVTPSMHGIELAAGHHPNDLNRYRELIGMVGSSFPEHLLYGNIRRLLNVRYFLWPDNEIGPAPEGPVLSRLQYSDGRTHSTLLAEAGLPRARLVGSAVVKSDSEAIPYMLTETFDPAIEVVLAEVSPIHLSGAPSSGSVTWVERTPNRLELTVRSAEPALLVISDNWFPAWKATVDGEEAPLLRAYHTLRAVPVPAGDHTVTMVYESEAVAKGLWVSIVALLSVVGAAGFEFWRDRQRESVA
jgi:hypothetical protein